MKWSSVAAEYLGFQKCQNVSGTQCLGGKCLCDTMSGCQNVCPSKCQNDGVSKCLVCKMTGVRMSKNQWCWWQISSSLHIFPFGKFHRIRGAPPQTFPKVKYDTPEEVGDNRKCFDSPIRKWGLVQILYVNSSRALTLCSLTVFCCH